jgi:hypothetical protein
MWCQLRQLALFTRFHALRHALQPLAATLPSALLTSQYNVLHARSIFEFMDAQFIAKYHPNHNVSDMQTITCEPMGLLLSKLGITEIDFFSLDVEGAELLVLQSIDFSRFHFRVVTIETENRDKEVLRQIDDLLAHHGYLNMGSDPADAERRNTWYMHRHYKPSSMPGMEPKPQPRASTQDKSGAGWFGRRAHVS